MKKTARIMKDKHPACRVCGWAEHMAVHQKVIDGPRTVEVFDHIYRPPKGATSSAAKGE